MQAVLLVLLMCQSSQATTDNGDHGVDVAEDAGVCEVTCERTFKEKKDLS